MARAETFLDETGGNAAPFTEQTEKLKLEGRGNEVRFISFERTLDYNLAYGLGPRNECCCCEHPIA